MMEIRMLESSNLENVNLSFLENTGIFNSGSAV